MQLHETRHLLAPIAQKCTCYLLDRFCPRPITAFGIELSKHRPATCSAKVNRLSMIALTLESVKRSSYCALTRGPCADKIQASDNTGNFV